MSDPMPLAGQVAVGVVGRDVEPAVFFPTSEWH